MKNNFVITTFLIALFSSFNSFSHEINNQQDFNETKTKALNNLKEVRVDLDKTIDCISRAQQVQDMDQCSKVQQESVQKIKEKNQITDEQIQQGLKNLNN